MSSDAINKTPLHGLHVELGARMVPFAGYEMPVQFPAGVKTEHLHTRAKAGLFDVSHMGQVRISGTDAAERFEALVTGNITGLAESALRYTLFTNVTGGILDDLMVTNAGDHLFVVVNAACKETDLALMRAGLGDTVEALEDLALIALQGPSAVAVLAELAPGVAGLKFMTSGTFAIEGTDCLVSRCGYTGEDGFEISVPNDKAEALARRLLAHSDVEAIGLGARDSLRLEAGLCLYGHDIDTTTTPIEAGLSWAVPKRRREDGGFPGAEIIRRQAADGTTRRRVGIRPEGRAPAREGTQIADGEGRILGAITSGGFGPSIDGPVAMGYVETEFAEEGTQLNVIVRDKPMPARVEALPFVPPGYKR